MPRENQLQGREIDLYTMRFTWRRASRRNLCIAICIYFQSGFNKKKKKIVNIYVKEIAIIRYSSNYNIYVKVRGIARDYINR